MGVSVGGTGVSVGWLVGKDWVGVGSRVLVGVRGGSVVVAVGETSRAVVAVTVAKNAGVGVNGNRVGVGS